MLCIVVTGQAPDSFHYFGQKPPGQKAERFAPGIISTKEYEHSAPSFSPDGKIILWCIMDRQYRGYLMEMRYENGKWQGPQRPSFADTTADDYYPSFSPDGKTVFFSSRRKMPEGFKSTGNIRLWQVPRQRDGWGEPKPVDTTISKGEDYGHSTTRTGNLYFATAQGGGTNWNIRRATRVNGKFQTPTTLPYSINSVDYEDGPYISPDESFLIFESQRPEGINGSVDLYISFRQQNDAWTLPINMGPRINTGATERFARLSPDGKYLFFGSFRENTADNWGADIYWIDSKIIDSLKSAARAQTIPMPLGKQLIEALYKNNSERSATALQQWLLEYPNHLDATLLYSAAMRKANNWLAAEKLLNNREAWEQNIHFILENALVQFGLDKADDARRLLEPVLKDPDQLWSRYLYLSNALLDMKEFAISDDYFEKAMRVFLSSGAYYRRGASYATIGDFDRAFRNLNQAADLGHNSKSHYQSDPMLGVLHIDPRWKLLLQKLR